MKEEHRDTCTLSTGRDSATENRLGACHSIGSLVDKSDSGNPKLRHTARLGIPLASSLSPAEVYVTGRLRPSQQWPSLFERKHGNRSARLALLAVRPFSVIRFPFPVSRLLFLFFMESSNGAGGDAWYVFSCLFTKQKLWRPVLGGVDSPGVRKGGFVQNEDSQIVGGRGLGLWSLALLVLVLGTRALRGEVVFCDVGKGLLGCWVEGIIVPFGESENSVVCREFLMF